MIAQNFDTILIRSSRRKWSEGPATGVQIAPLCQDKSGESLLLQFKAGSLVPVHPHPGGEHLYVIFGTIRILDRNLFTGDYLWTSPGISTDAEAFEDTLILLVKPVHYVGI